MTWAVLWRREIDSKEWRARNNLVFWNWIEVCPHRAPQQLIDVEATYALLGKLLHLSLAEHLVQAHHERVEDRDRNQIASQGHEVDAVALIKVAIGDWMGAPRPTSW